MATATSARVHDGKQIMANGPVAETHEQLGGFFLINGRDLDEAISIVERTPVAKFCREYCICGYFIVQRTSERRRYGY